MSVQEFVQGISVFMREHQNYAAPIAFLVAFGESLCFASIIWPGWAILVGFSGALAASGVAPSVLTPMVIAAGVGGTLGYALSYWIGVYFKDSIPNVWPFSRHPDLIPRGEKFFNHYGTWSVFLGHFVGPVRAVIPVVAGMFRMPQLRFQVANTISAFIWAAWAVLAPFWGIYYKEPIFAFIVAHEHLAAFGMFALALIHSLPIPLLFWPTVALLFGGGLLYLFAGGNPYYVFFAGVAGVFFGDLIGYWAGAKRGRDLDSLWPISWYPDGIQAAHNFLARWGVSGVVFSKFLGISRAYVPAVAGATSVSLPLFILASLVSAVLAVAVCLSPRFILQFLGF